jgi:Zn-dependent peptidase ImmA (M78 family)
MVGDCPIVWSYSSIMEAKLVPATPSVIAWAIRESGYSLRALATLLRLSEQEIESWTKGTSPELAKLQAFAAAVERPFSAFLLPHPPASRGPSVRFRSASSAKARDLNPEERRRIGEAGRLQEIASWLTRQMQLPAPDLPLSSTKADPEDVAATIRARLSVSVNTQQSWSSSAEALRAWREAVEALGVAVLMLPMGEESCRGFCIWDDAAPLIAINTAWLPEARVFTLFHELAHLATRTNSACAEDTAPRPSTAGDRTERWCERVAAAVVVPAEALSTVLSEISGTTTRHVVDLSTVSRIANRFRVSRRAAALRLIECHEASWPLFRSIPPHADRQRSGGGGAGRTRLEIRRQRYGQRTMGLFRDAIRQRVLAAADVVDYLGVSADALTNSVAQPVRQEDV